MERKEGIRRLRLLKGVNLHDVAAEHGVTVASPSGKGHNKGWAGTTLERHLGLEPGGGRNPNFGSWELKSTPIKKGRKSWLYKETMQLTMLDEEYIKEETFEESYFLRKLQVMVIALRIVGKHWSDFSTIYGVHEVEIKKGTEFYALLKHDYELVQKILRTEGFGALHGGLGWHMEPRTKGAGHGSTSRAFYARKSFLVEAIGDDSIRYRDPRSPDEKPVVTIEDPDEETSD